MDARSRRLDRSSSCLIRARSTPSGSVLLRSSWSRSLASLAALNDAIRSAYDIRKSELSWSIPKSLKYFLGSKSDATVNPLCSAALPLSAGLVQQRGPEASRRSCPLRRSLQRGSWQRARSCNAASRATAPQAGESGPDARSEDLGRSSAVRALRFGGLTARAVVLLPIHAAESRRPARVLVLTTRPTK